MAPAPEPARPPAGSLAGVLPGALAALGWTGAADPLGLAQVLGPVRQVAVLLVDGLGHHLLPAAAQSAPVLASLPNLELSSAFPSTTPTSLVTLGTGVLPGAHGVVGFTVNVPGTDDVLTHIEWRDTPPPEVWQPAPRLLAEADRAGITTAVVSDRSFAGSGLTLAAYGDAPYAGEKAGVRRLAARMLDELSRGTRLVYGYHAALDQAMHLHGIDSPQWRAAAADVGDLITRLGDGLPPDTALLVTADHGGMDIPAENRLDVDTDPRLSAGVRVVAGEPRARYLHTEPGAVPDVVAAWRAVLGTHALVLTRDEVVDGGWFGPVRPEHLGRIGDVVVVCLDHTVVLATAHEPAVVARLVGFHGGVSAAETAVPLLLLRP